MDYSNLTEQRDILAALSGAACAYLSQEFQYNPDPTSEYYSSIKRFHKLQSELFIKLTSDNQSMWNNYWETYCRL